MIFKKIFSKIFFILSLFLRGKLTISGKNYKFINKSSIKIDLIVDEHFNLYNSCNHVSYNTIKIALKFLHKNNNNPTIIETGSSAWGINSTILFDTYVSSCGGKLFSVDIRLNPIIKLYSKIHNNTYLYLDNSISFLNTKVSLNSIDFLYLDSWDVDWSNPIPSAIHGLNEFLISLEKLKSKSLILIDDTPINLEYVKNNINDIFSETYKFYNKYGFMPGKGALIYLYILNNPLFTILSHEYQLLLRYEK